ncbi:CoA transferase [Pseudonocardia endophytica]|uniref:CoA transferase family III n=1 Tax=Pseudonocardia endophytica TaxID=401976 RepID=A0A4V2PHT5_PSEEN|nr:CoA transferase [Pseudonocardia endophytica]TCK22016.1 CoA transferase family III [Pseudonocardia endophytica]
MSDPAGDWAASGAVALTGHRAGPPLVPPGRAASYAQELGALFDVDGAALLAERAAFTGHSRRGRISAGGGCRLLRVADGWAAVSCTRPDDPALLGALVEGPIPDDAPWPALTSALATIPSSTLDDRAALLGVAAHSVASGAPAGTPVTVTGPPRSVQDAVVVSFGALWAGPLCAQLLACRGARVVTVETPRRPDPSRERTPGFHALLHARDRSVVLDPADPTGRAALRALVAAADVVIEASRPRALRGFGLDAEAEVARGATWISITAAGRGSERVGFGDDVAASAGLVARDGDGLPVFVGDAIADPLTGLAAAALAITAPGVLHDVSMTRVVATTLDGTPGGDAVGLRVASPRARPVPGPAPAVGADTAAVLAELGVLR